MCGIYASSGSKLCLLQTFGIFLLAVYFIEKPKDGNLFRFVAHHFGVVVRGVDAVVGKNAINVIKVVRPRHHDVQIPVVEGKTRRNRKDLVPRLAASDRRRSSNEVLPQEGDKFVSLEIRPLMSPVAPFHTDLTAIIH